MSDSSIKKFLINELLSQDFRKLTDITDKWGYFRQVYMENIPSILQTSRRDIKKWNNAYLLDWYSFLSPIERVAWNSIRNDGHIVLYPQFPVFNFFIDFANPYLRVGLELDGKDFHSNSKDLKRDEKLARLGWRIFRVSGSETKINYLNRTEISENNIVGKEKIKAIEHWILNTCDGVLQAIKYWYYMNDEEKEKKYSILVDPEYSDEIIDFHNLAERSLKKHRLVEFPL